MSTEPWIHNAIIYQVNLRSIASREPRNPIEAANETDIASSPLNYLARNIDVVRQLGVTVLHVMPPFPMGRVRRKGIGSPYSARDFCEIDPEHGTLEEFQTLIRTAHTIGLKIIVGMVPNHTSRDHEWISHFPEHYVTGDDGTPAFDEDWSDTAKLDYTKPGLRAAMIDIFDFWLKIGGFSEEDRITQGVDGFRIDMAHAISDRSFWDEAIPALRERHPDRDLLFLAECYGFENNLDLMDRGFDAAYDDDLYKIPQYFYGLDGEGGTCLLESPEAKHNLNFNELYMAYVDRGLAGAVETALVNYEQRLAKVPADKRLARYTDNHDEGRGVYRFGDGAVLAFTQLIFLSGRSIPFLLAGQEFGAMNRPSIHERIAPCDKGFRRKSGEEIVEIAGVEFEGNLFARGVLRRKGWYAFYRDLVALRIQTPELSHGAFKLLECGERCPQNQRTVVAFERKFQDQIVRCAVNLGPEPRTMAHHSLFSREPLYGAIKDGVLAPFTSVVVRST